ncbi:MAG: DoxX family protein [Sphingobacteriales bacterium JAD_PAG50586_3]|nr:MAG: DoxX family protein [Sphingobacteriales bacterium JAD_PAG50586_3]
MKATKITYWVSTVLFAGFMAFTAIPNILGNADSVGLFTSLGFPLYMQGFIGMAKLLGSIALLVPAFPRIKEWAYAGLFFDLSGAMYAVMALGAPFTDWSFFLIFIAVEAVSYFSYHKLQAAKLKSV